MQGEEAQLVVQPTYAYGDVDTAGPLAPVPAGSTITYHVTLKDFKSAKVLNSSLAFLKGSRVPRQSPFCASTGCPAPAVHLS
jgi:hypothetical protein